jgi:VCBS repeat-containing protein
VGSDTGTYGSLALAGNTGAWTYTLANGANGVDGAVQDLAAGETVHDTFTVQVMDDKGAVDTQVVTIDITGTNDAPLINAETTVATGTVSEGDPLHGADMAATGVITYTDVDTSDTHTLTLFTDSTHPTAVYGTASVDPHTGVWTYTVADQGAVDHLAVGEHLTDHFTVQVDDHNGGFAYQTVDITITGTNDAPTIEANAVGGTVYESGLGIGSAPGGEPIFVVGHFTVGDAEGVNTITAITLGSATIDIPTGTDGTHDISYIVGHEFSAGYGSVHIDSYNSANATFTYTYTLTDAYHGGSNESDGFHLAVSDGMATAGADVTINIVDDQPIISNATDLSLLNLAGTSSAGHATLISGADQPALADLTSNVAGWAADGNHHSVGHSTNGDLLSSSGQTVYYYVDPEHTDTLIAYTDSGTSVSDYSAANSAQHQIFTLSLDNPVVDGTGTENYHIDMSDTVFAETHVTYGTVFSTNVGGNPEFLSVTDDGHIYKDATNPAGSTVIMTIDSDQGTVNTSAQGMGVGSQGGSAGQFIGGAEQLNFHFSHPTMGAEFSVNYQGSGTSGSITWWATDGTNIDYGTLTNVGTTFDIPTTLTSLTEIKIGAVDGSAYRVTSASVVESIVQGSVQTVFHVGATDSDGSAAAPIADFSVTFEGNSTDSGTHLDSLLGDPHHTHS